MLSKPSLILTVLRKWLTDTHNKFSIFSDARSVRRYHRTPYRSIGESDPQKASDKLQIANIIKKSAVFLFVSSLLLTIACLVFAPLISLVKVDFAPSVTPFRILSASLPIFFLSSLFMWVLIAQDKQWLLLKIYGAGMIVNIVLNLLFIPRFGYYAAAVITVVSEAVVLFFLLRSYVSLGTGAPKISQFL